MNRKLVRPNLAEIKEKFGGSRPAQPDPPSRPRKQTGGSTRRRPSPPDNTSAEAFYYLKQMNAQTPMVVHLDNGEQLRGHIEWYDRMCIKVHRENAPNLLVYKHSIRFMYKEEEETGSEAG